MRRLLAVAVAAAAALGGCVGIEPGPSAREGGTISVGVSRSLDSLDPAAPRSASAREVLSLLYVPPLTYAVTDGRLELVPALAERLPESTGAGAAWAFRLRRGLRYSDGRAVTAGDVAHALRRARRLDPEARRLLAGVERVSTDERRRSVSIELRAPDPDFPHALAEPFAAPVPRSTPLRELPWRPPPGSGPYELARSRPGRGFTLRRRRDFGVPGLEGGYLSAIHARVGGTSAEVADGRLDYAQDAPSAALLPIVRSKYRHRYAQHAGLATRFVALDAGRPPFDDRRVRQALALALDRRRLAVFANGFLEPACNLLPPSLPGHVRLDPCPWGDPHEQPDLLRARSLVRSARAAGTTVAVAAPRADRRLARELRATLREIGLRPRARRGAAQARLAVLSAPLPTARAYLVPLARSAADARLRTLARELRLEREPARAAALASQLDHGLVSRALAVPIGYVERPTFVSERIDARNCARFDPWRGADWAALCLR